MKIYKHLPLILLAASMACVPAQAQKKSARKKAEQHVVETPVNHTLFLYSPKHDQGFHVAHSADGKTFSHVGQLFASDYSSWGWQKKMYSPFISKLPTGGYAAVFSVNDFSPCLAVAYSDDMLTWRPQDYPYVSAKGCLAPVIRYDGGQSYSILFKTKEGQVRRITTDAQFRQFSSDIPATQAEYDAIGTQTDKATVGDQTFSGLLHAVSPAMADSVKTYFAKIDSDNAAWRESLADDGQRFASIAGKTVDATLTIDFANQKPISDKLIGIFFEDISYAADGGLYAEMVQNRDFEYNTKDRREWNATTSWRSSAGEMVVSEDKPLSKNNPHHIIVKNETITNTGWDGMAVDKGAAYDFSLFVRIIDGKKKALTVSLVSDGKTIASAKITAKKDKGAKEWTKYEAVLIPTESADKAELVITPEKETAVALDMISLFPRDTFCGRKNGLRKDLAQALADLKPKFIRFPGGCMSHGQGLENIYHWHHTVGPLEDRVPDHNIWHYHQTRGLGFYEYFQFCEDVGAEPLPVLAAGVPCQNSVPNAEGYGGQQGGIPMEDMPAYIQEFLDLIEWANGDPATSKWAKMRADAGHPEPFNLKYIGVGNEDIISTVFEERCLMICQAIKERYPDIIVCGTVGPFHNPSSDYIEGWKFANQHRDCIDMVDEHYYESVGWFLHNQQYYDNYDRNGAQVYLGEYAARVGKGGIDCALAEALHLCNIERNADIVTMTSYAPLLSKDGHSNWSPDMIYFGNRRIELTPSYDTQRLFSVYGGDSYIASSLDVDSTLAYRIATSVVKDTKTGKTYLKIVNILPNEVRLNCINKQTGNSAIANATHNIDGFHGKPGSRKTDGTLKGTINGSEITLKPYSLTIVEL